MFETLFKFARLMRSAEIAANIAHAKAEQEREGGDIRRELHLRQEEQTHLHNAQRHVRHMDAVITSDEPLED